MFLFDDVQTLALINIWIQGALMATVVFTAYQARVSRKLKQHCAIMRVAMLVLVATIPFIMYPSLAEYVKDGLTFSWFSVELLAHPTLGVVVIGIWVYVNLALMRIIKVRHRLLGSMRIAFGAWIASFFLGLHLYLRIWT